MKRMLFVVVAVFVLVSCKEDAGKPASKNKADSVLVLDRATIGTAAPNGWVPIYKPNNIGLCVAYVLDSFNFDNSPAVMYPRIVSGKSVDDIAQEMAEKFKKKSSHFKFNRLENYKTKDQLEFKIREFLDGPKPNRYETVAYLPYEGKFLLYVFSALTKENYEKYQKNLYAALESVDLYSTKIKELSGSCVIPK